MTGSTPSNSGRGRRSQQPSAHTQMKAIVHIGMPKTGSTSIQSWLVANRAALAGRDIAYEHGNLPCEPENRRQGVLICQHAAVGKLIGNKSLRVLHKIFSLEDQRRFAERFEKHFARRVAGRRENTVVISSEYLGAATGTVDVATALDDWLRRYFAEVRYLVYFRRQEDWFASSYSQRLKRGTVKTLAEVVEQEGERDWFRVTEIWRKAVGQERLSVRILEKDSLHRGDLIADFAHQIGTDAEGLAPAPRMNEAFSAPAAEIMRALNEKMPQFIRNEKQVNLRKRKLRETLMAHSPDGPKPALTATQIALVRDLNRASNERLRARYFPDRPELFPARDGPGQSLEPAPEDVARIAVSLILQSRTRTGRKGRSKKNGTAKGVALLAAQPRLRATNALLRRIGARIRRSLPTGRTHG